MQQHMMKPVEELLTETRERLDATEQERDRVIDELQEMKRVAQDANMMLSEKTMTSRKVADLYTEINMLNESLSQELNIKDQHVELLKVEIGKEKKEMEAKLVEKDASLDELKEALDKLKLSEAHAMSLLSTSKKKIEELLVEIEKGKESEKKMLDSFVAQTKQLEQTKISLEESKLELDSLREKLKNWEGSTVRQRSLSASHSFLDSTKETTESLKAELNLAKQNLAHSQENERGYLMKAKSLLEEMNLLRNELKLATEAEENSKKAMDDLAFALKEVASESSLTKEKLTSTEAELEVTKAEAEQLKLKLKSTEEEYKKQVDELKKDSELYKNTAERLRIEAEESLLAWSGKESCFVGCIRRAEDERDIAQRENLNLLESLRSAENMIRVAKEENGKLRDILKQALNEANVAKEASGIAREENSQLQDALAEKEETLNFLSRENENLKMNESAALESIKELKRLLAEASARDSKSDAKEQGKKLKSMNNSMDDKELTKDGKKLIDAFGFTIKDLKIPNKHKDVEEHTHKDEDEESKLHNKNSENDDDEEDYAHVDPLSGSIFDVNSPGSARHHRKQSSSAFTDDLGNIIISEEVENATDGSHSDDTEGDKSTRKKKALIRRFGDLLLLRKSYHKKEPSVENTTAYHKKEPSMDNTIAAAAAAAASSSTTTTT